MSENTLKSKKTLIMVASIVVVALFLGTSISPALANPLSSSAPASDADESAEEDCKELFWFDAETIKEDGKCECSKFCGSYAYPGLQTFDSEKACDEKLREVKEQLSDSISSVKPAPADEPALSAADEKPPIDEPAPATDYKILAVNKPGLLRLSGSLPMNKPALLNIIEPMVISLDDKKFDKGIPVIVDLDNDGIKDLFYLVATKKQHIPYLKRFASEIESKGTDCPLCNEYLGQDAAENIIDALEKLDDDQKDKLGAAIANAIINKVDLNNLVDDQDEPMDVGIITPDDWTGLADSENDPMLETILEDYGTVQGSVGGSSGGNPATNNINDLLGGLGTCGQCFKHIANKLVALAVSALAKFGVTVEDILIYIEENPGAIRKAISTAIREFFSDVLDKIERGIEIAGLVGQFLASLPKPVQKAIFWGLLFSADILACIILPGIYTLITEAITTGILVITGGIASVLAFCLSPGIRVILLGIFIVFLLPRIIAWCKEHFGDDTITEAETLSNLYENNYLPMNNNPANNNPANNNPANNNPTDDYNPTNDDSSANDKVYITVADSSVSVGDPIQVTVKDQDGNKISGVKVTFGFVNKGNTDINGYIDFPAKALNVPWKKVRATKSGCDSASPVKVYVALSGNDDNDDNDNDNNNNNNNNNPPEENDKLCITVADSTVSVGDPIQVTVKDQDGNKISGVKVTFGFVNKGNTDINGYIDFPAKALNIPWKKVRATKSGCDSASPVKVYVSLL